MMRIKVFQTHDGNWRADPVDLPGSPINGVGKCRWSAVGSLLFAIRHEKEWERWGWPAINIVDAAGNEFPPYPVEGIDEQIVRVRKLASNSDVMVLRGALRKAVDLLTLRMSLADITDDEKYHLTMLKEMLGNQFYEGE